MNVTDKKDDFPVLVERRLKFQSISGGPMSDIVIQIGHPQWMEGNVEALCPVAFRGEIGRVKDMRGEDPLDALKNAIMFSEMYLERRMEQVKFFWSNGEAFVIVK